MSFTTAAAAQPLLSKPYPPLELPIASISGHEQEQEVKTLAPLKTCLFSFCFVSSFYAPSSSEFCLCHRNPHCRQISSFIYNTTSSEKQCDFSVIAPKSSLFTDLINNSLFSDKPTTLNSISSSLVKNLIWTL
ncbi:pentatricopeptide repeat (PPR) superfamily protein, partial [Striga asiatica]